MSFWDDATDYISAPFKKIAEGKVGDGLLDMAKKFTPAGIIYDQLDTISQRHVHIANATGMPIAVVVSANKDWSYADIGASAAILVASLGSSAPSGLNAIKQARTLMELYTATKALRATVGVGVQVYKAFAKKGTTIENGQVTDIIQRSNTNPFHYLNPSQYGAIANASDLTVMIVREDGKLAIFNTNSDTSWIMYPPSYCRSQYGKLWMPDDSESRNWNA
ncbi:hypothetical protein VB713_20555 [Anabaena cylindrica UHCC 0172]|uniref:hypothetical protein n=1 Tax=Anabaena cylindrica TaxID=1165 RepID=UPI002B214C09|nr:hypothetical protein [Anabaena cylindrica]MEA5553334.1 hypothetical protein [Anabaena cylindrica UHCC 0172]